MGGWGWQGVPQGAKLRQLRQAGAAKAGGAMAAKRKPTDKVLRAWVLRAFRIVSAWLFEGRVV